MTSHFVDPAWLVIAVAVMLAAIGVVALWIFHRPEVGLLATLALFPLQKTVHLPVVGPKFTFAEGAFLLALLALGSAFLLGRRTFAVPRGGLLLPAFLFVLVGVASLSNVRGRQSLLLGGFEVLTFCYLLVFYCWLATYLKGERELRLLLVVWGVSTGVVVLFGLVGGAAMLTGRGSASPFVFGGARVCSTFRNPNALASYLVPAFFVFLGLAQGRWYERWWWHVGNWILVALVLIVCLFSMSRASFVALAVGAAVYAALSFQGARIFATVCMLCLLIGALFFALSGDWWNKYAAKRVSTLLAVSSFMEEVRGRQLQRSLEFVAMHPVVGVGLGTSFKYAEARGGPELRSHNTLLTAWVETGTLGLLAMGWLGAGALSLAWRNFRKAGTARFRSLNLGLLAALVGMAAYSLFHDAARHRHMWLVFAVITAIFHIQSKPVTIEPPPSCQPQRTIQ